MKINEKTIELVLLLLIIVVATFTYRFGYVEYSDKTEEVEKQSRELTAKIANLETRISRMNEVEGGLTEAELHIRDVLDTYGSGNSPEKSLMMIAEMERHINVKISSVSFGPETCFFRSEELKDDGTPRISAYKTTLSVSYTTDYQGMKEMMDFINDYPERMNVESINSVYNADNDGVTGSMIINLYSVEGDGREYVEPEIMGFELGKANIFD